MSTSEEAKREAEHEDSLLRLDFVNSMEWKDREQGILQFVMKPDPRRYEWVEEEGRRLLYDRYDEIYFPEEVLKQLPALMEGMPIGLQPAGIAYAPAYVRDRRQRIMQKLAQGSSNEDSDVPRDKSDEFLEALADHALGFAILSLDLVGSTELITRLPKDEFNLIMETLLYECSLVVPEFHGHVLKYTGDGLIAYFPEPSFIIKNDLAIDCALTMHGLVYAAINPCLAEAGLPKIDIRIGLDSGQASVLVLGSSETKRHADIIGAAVSLASKVQGLSTPGGICLGEVLERNLHVMWREICELCPPPSGWAYKGLEGKPYKVFRVLDDALERNLRSMES
jgi:class 3 adenylate cyclase